MTSLGFQVKATGSRVQVPSAPLSGGRPVGAGSSSMMGLIGSHRAPSERGSDGQVHPDGGRWGPMGDSPGS